MRSKAASYRYRSTRSDDGALRRRLREVSSERRRFRYLLMGIPLVVATLDLSREWREVAEELRELVLSPGLGRVGRDTVPVDFSLDAGI